MDNSEFILTELIRISERLASIETSTASLVGNGQPGRITLIEQKVEKLQQWRWRVVGIATGASGIVSLIAWIAKH